MKFYASIAAGVCTIWLGFEPDPDQSWDSEPDLHRIFESRKTAFNFGSDTDHIQDTVSVSGFYPDY